MSFYFAYHANITEEIKSLSLAYKLRKKLYTEKKMHTTMLYSHAQYQEKYQDVILPPISVKIKDVVIWYNEFNNYLVALLEEQELTQYHLLLQDKINVELEERGFRPHITLQKTDKEKEPLSPTLFQSLIGKEILLDKFECIFKHE